MTSNKRGIMDLPYEIHANIYKKLPLTSIQSLALTNKHMLHTYENINLNYMDKISFNTLYDHFENFKTHKKLREIIMDLFQMVLTYEECIKFCFNQREMETIKIKSIIKDDFKYANIPYAYLPNLTHVEISVLTQCENDTDYLFPIIECTTALKSIKYENGTLTRDSMMQISKNEKLKCFKLQNISIHNIPAFRMLLSKMKNIEELRYYNFHFIRLMATIKILESIFEIALDLPKLRDIKISAWQELNLDTIRETRLHKATYTNFKLEKGHSTSFFSAILPLLNQYSTNSFEIFYLNHEYPNVNKEKSAIRYKLIDSCSFLTKAFKYGTD